MARLGRRHGYLNPGEEVTSRAVRDRDGHFGSPGVWKNRTVSAVLTVDQLSLHDPTHGRAHAERVRILQNLAVAPAYRGQGIGKQLVEYVEKRTKAAGASYVIGIASCGDISGVYERLGYRVLSRGELLLLDIDRSLLTHPVNPAANLRWFAKKA